MEKIGYLNFKIVSYSNSTELIRRLAATSFNTTEIETHLLLDKLTANEIDSIVKDIITLLDRRLYDITHRK